MNPAASIVDIPHWVRAAPDAHERELRQAVHTIVTAVTRDENLRATMIMKGGILLAMRYGSPRFTRDIDFSTPLKLGEVTKEEVRQRMDAALRLTVELLDYGLDCRVQRCEVRPPNKPAATFPCIELGIGYAPKGTPLHKRLLQGQCPHAVSIDYSLNEAVEETDTLALGEGDGTLRVYSLVEVVAEKLRALLQQPLRNRYRRQDVYDLARLMDQLPGPDLNGRILTSLRHKCRARGIEPGPGSLDDPEIRRRAEAEYLTLKDDVPGELPAFAISYAAVLAFYHSLPWDKEEADKSKA